MRNTGTCVRMIGIVDGINIIRCFEAKGMSRWKTTYTRWEASDTGMPINGNLEKPSAFVTGQPSYSTGFTSS